MVLGGCIGHSDHEMREFSVLGEVRKVVSKTSALDFQRVVTGLFRTLVQRVPWETDLNNKEIQECGKYFQKEILKVQEQAVPMC